MSTRGIDIRQQADRIVFRASLKDSDGADLATGTTELRVLRVEDDGTLDVYDWTTNDFVAAGSGTPDDETTMTHRQRRDSTGADVDTGVWTVVLSTLTNWTKGQVYIAKVTNTGAMPPSQEREFQFGGVEGQQLGVATAGREANVFSDGSVEAGTGSAKVDNANPIQSDVALWRGSQPNALSSGRVEALVGAMSANVMTAAAAAADFGSELQALITGGAYALSTGSDGKVRIVDGTGAGELDTNNGHVILQDGSLVTAKLGTFALAKTTNITGFNDLSAAQVNAEADTALSDYDPPTHTELLNLFRLAMRKDSGIATDLASLLTTINANLGSGAGAFSNITEANEALRDRGDAAWLTATGFSTHSAADVWAVATRLLTAGTNIVLAKGIGITGFNDITAAEVWAAATRTLTALGFDLAAGDFAAGAIDANALALDAVQEIRNAITGGAYPLDTGSDGKVRVVDGTGAGEIDLTSGLVKISGTIQTLDALDTAQDLQHAATQAAITALNDLSAADIMDVLETPMTESYAANGDAPSLVQATFAMHQKLMAMRYSGTQSIVLKLDGVTQAFVGTLDDADNPTEDIRVAA